MNDKRSANWTRRRFLAAMVAGTVGAGHGLMMRPPRVWASTEDGPVVDADFPAGNIIFEEQRKDAFYLRQDPRDTDGWWFYWYFRVRGAEGREITFRFTDRDVLTAGGPCVSTDGGETWFWQGRESGDPEFAYVFGDTDEEVRFCLAVPYTEAHLNRFMEKHAGSPHLRLEHHGDTRKGRAIERLHVGCIDSEPRHRILLTARTHACEMMANWSMEGLLDAVLADNELGAYFRENVEIAAIPFMDKDGVEDGDQGKNRRPHDHNRDFVGDSIYPSVAALREFGLTWPDGKLRIGMDMHCPWIRGGGDNRGSNERIFLVGQPDEAHWREQQAFSEIMEDVQTGALRHYRRHNLPHGETWNTLEEPRTCSRWMAGVEGVILPTTIEIPYAIAAGQAGATEEVTAESAHAFGADLAKAMRVYLEER